MQMTADIIRISAPTGTTAMPINKAPEGFEPRTHFAINNAVSTSRPPTNPHLSVLSTKQSSI